MWSCALRTLAVSSGLFRFIRFYSLALVLVVRTRQKGKKFSLEVWKWWEPSKSDLGFYCVWWFAIQHAADGHKWQVKQPMAWPAPRPMCLDVDDTWTRLLQVPASAFSIQESNTLSAASLFPLPSGASKSIFPARAMEGQCIRWMHLLLNHAQVCSVRTDHVYKFPAFPIPLFPPFLSTPHLGLPVWCPPLKIL